MRLAGGFAGLMRRVTGERRPLVTLRRRGGSPPPDWEMLTIEPGGRFTLWRTIARGTPGTPRIGWFEGDLPAADVDGLRHALKACSGAAPTRPAPPDASMDTIRAGNLELTLPSDAAPPPDWADAVARLRPLVDRLTAHPAAAVGVEAGVASARLVHLGTRPLDLDLSNATVRVVRWEDGAPRATWSAPLGGPRSETAAPGWSSPLPFAHGLGEDAPLTLEVSSLLAFDGHFWRSCALHAAVVPG